MEAPNGSHRCAHVRILADDLSLLQPLERVIDGLGGLVRLGVLVHSVIRALRCARRRIKVPSVPWPRLRRVAQAPLA